MPQLGVHARQMPALRRMHTKKKSVSEAAAAFNLREDTVRSLFDEWDDKEAKVRGGGSRRKKQETIPAKDEFS